MSTSNSMVIRSLYPSDLPDIFYEEPELVEDGMHKAMPLNRIRLLLYKYYAERPDALVADGRSYIMYNRDNGYDRIDPDLYITFDVNAERILKAMPNFWVWNVGKTPDFALEMASLSTAAADSGPRRDMYQRLGISEYWRLDYTGGEFYGQPVLGERLVDGVYVPYEIHTRADGSVISHSELLDLVFSWNEADEFDILTSARNRSIDPVVREREARQAAEARADRAFARADTERIGRLYAETRVRELQEKVERLRSQQSGQ